eukprot:932-Heterococcus_DN1.PRE.2
MQYIIQYMKAHLAKCILMLLRKRALPYSNSATSTLAVYAATWRYTRLDVNSVCLAQTKHRAHFRYSNAMSKHTLHYSTTSGTNNFSSIQQK